MLYSKIAVCVHTIQTGNYACVWRTQKENSCFHILLLVFTLSSDGLFEKLEFSKWKCQVEDLKESVACFWFSTLVETARQCLHSRRGGRGGALCIHRNMKWECRSSLLASFFGGFLFFQDSLTFVGFLAHLASSTCYPILGKKKPEKEAGI